MTYYVYILTNKRNTVLYVGVTNNPEARVFQHKAKLNRGFTAKYNCNKLVYFEEFNDVTEAIHREKQLKRYRRTWKEDLIIKGNPEWKDLSEKWYDKKEFELQKKLMDEEPNPRSRRAKNKASDDILR